MDVSSEKPVSVFLTANACADLHGPDEASCGVLLRRV